MSTQQIRVEAHTAASPAEVYALLSDGTTWPRWGGFESFELETPAPGVGGEGVGAVRAFTSRSWGRRIVSRERITELVPDRRLGYALVSGLPLRNYRASVDLEPVADGGTRIVWSSQFDGAESPGSAWFYRRVLQRFIERTAQALGRAALEQAGSSR
jgi:uncharacterized protein YndB with AHSA1/START domain